MIQKADILAAVGPSICQDCYEVSGDVIEKFKEAFDEKDWDNLFYRKNNGKYQLDLWKANESVFRESGICKEHIAVTNVCTHCNSKILYSHRETGDKRGNLCAFLALNKILLENTEQENREKQILSNCKNKR